MPFVTVFTRGDFSLELFAPRGIDTQQPHEQDEAYIVASGAGTFRRGEERAQFVAGDFLFVPAGMAHAFESFTEDFRTRVVFFGPKGGIGRSTDEQHTQVPAVDAGRDALCDDGR